MVSVWWYLAFEMKMHKRTHAHTRSENKSDKKNNNKWSVGRLVDWLVDAIKISKTSNQERAKHKII